MQEILPNHEPQVNGRADDSKKRSTEPFVKLPRRVLARRSKDLPPAAKLVYAVVADRMGQNGESWPGVRRIGYDCGLSPGTVTESIAQLERLGLLIVDRVNGNPAGRTNRYRLTDRTEFRALDIPHVPNTERRALDIPHAERSVFDTEPDQYNQTKQAEVLLDAGVDEGTAKRLAAEHGPDRVAAAVKWADERRPRNPAGFIVSILTDSAKRAELDKRATAERAAREEADRRATERSGETEMRRSVAELPDAERRRLFPAAVDAICTANPSVTPAYRRQLLSDFEHANWEDALPLAWVEAMAAAARAAECNGTADDDIFADGAVIHAS